MIVEKCVVDWKLLYGSSKKEAQNVKRPGKE